MGIFSGMFLSKKRKNIWNKNNKCFEREIPSQNLITLLGNCEENNKNCVYRRQSRIYLQLMNIFIYFFFWSFYKAYYIDFFFVVYLSILI